MSWEVEFDTSDIEVFATKHPLLVQESLNETVEYAAGLLLEAVVKIYNVPPDELSKSKNMKVVKANNTLEAKIILTGKSIPIIKFAARQTSTGVTFQIKRESGPKSIPHAFIAGMKSGHAGVFRRSGTHRLPIEERFTLSLADMISSNDVVDSIDEKVGDFFEAAMNKRVDAQLEAKAA